MKPVQGCCVSQEIQCFCFFLTPCVERQIRLNEHCFDNHLDFFMSSQTFKSPMNNRTKNKQNKQTKNRLQKVCCWINRKHDGQFNTSSFLHVPEEAIPLDCPVISKIDWKSQAWWLMPAIPALGRLLQKPLRLRLPRLPTECQANLGNSMRPCLKSTQRGGGVQMNDYFSP